MENIPEEIINLICFGAGIVVGVCVSGAALLTGTGTKKRKSRPAGRPGPGEIVPGLCRKCNQNPNKTYCIFSDCPEKGIYPN